jgi:hypothetical protein
MRRPPVRTPVNAHGGRRVAPADLLPKEALQPFLALDQRELGRAYAVKEQEIEGKEDKLIGAPFIHRSLKTAEGGHPFRI